MSELDLTDNPSSSCAQSSLLSLVEPKESSAVNEHPEHRLHDILNGPSGGKWLESDADEQLLIHLSVSHHPNKRGPYP